MSDILLDTQSPPATPAAGQIVLFGHSSNKQIAAKNETGKIITLGGIQNCSIADQLVSAADNYLAGSNLSIPSHLLQVSTMMRWTIIMTKTAAGLAAPTWNVRVGTLGTIADTSRLLFTSGFAQTAVVDEGRVDIVVVVRSIGAAGVIAGQLQLSHNLQITGFATVPSPTIYTLSGGFDMTVPNLIFGISVNPGSAGAWTHKIIQAELMSI